jgi:hypothetical protein
MRFTIDPKRRLVTSIVEGTLTYQDAVAHQDGLRAHPDFDPNFDQLADFTACTDFSLNTGQMQTLAARSVFSPKSRRVGVAPQPLAVGLLRMFENYRRIYGGEEAMHIVPTRAEALLWLYGSSKEK